MNPRVSIVSLGCARNDVDSEELAGRLEADGWQLAPSGTASDVVLVNTCGFIEQAKKDSIDALLEAADSAGNAKVVAVGCLAQRHGVELAAELPEAAAVLGFDDYADIGNRLRDVLAGRHLPAPQPHDRRLLPIVDTASTSPIFRQRLETGPWAPLKIASGCDRRCTFCAIPSFRGSFRSRDPQDVIDEGLWLAQQGVRELFLVSENSTSYGKDLGDIRLLEKLLPALAGLPGIDRVRVSYLQPAEIRPDLIRVLVQSPGVAPYLDLSFQHASPEILRRMRRFGGAEQFLQLLAAARALNPDVGARTNVIVGFPGETESDLAILEDFLVEAQLDAVGVFGYSDEEGTAAVELPDHVDSAEVQSRVSHINDVVQRVCDAAARRRVGSSVSVLIEDQDNVGRSLHQGPEVDGITVVMAQRVLAPGEVVTARVIDTDGIDLIAEMT